MPAFKEYLSSSISVVARVRAVRFANSERVAFLVLDSLCSWLVFFIIVVKNCLSKNAIIPDGVSYIILRLFIIIPIY